VRKMYFHSEFCAKMKELLLPLYVRIYHFVQQRNIPQVPISSLLAIYLRYHIRVILV